MYLVDAAPKISRRDFYMGLISILSGALNGNFNPISAFAYILSTAVVIFLVLPFHEFAHAFSAHKLGDNTAKYMGRMSLNPFRHIDWVGAALIMAVGFGWAKPVPVNARLFKNPKKDMAIVALAGPLSNLLAAFVSLFLFNLVNALLGLAVTAGSEILLFILAFLKYMFRFLAQINISLAVFNLIPIPPLDGSRLLTALLPDRIYYKIMAYEQYIMLALILLMITGVLTVPLSYLSNLILTGFNAVASLPFGG